MQAIRAAGGLRVVRAASQPDLASLCSTSSKQAWRKRCLAYQPRKRSRSVPDSERLGCWAPSITIRLKPGLEEFARSRTTPEACKAALAIVKIFTSALRLNRLQRSRSNRKPSPLQGSKLHLRPADGMIRVFFHELCRSSKQWQRSFFAITPCDKTRSAPVFRNCLTQSPRRIQRDDGERNC